MQRPGLFFAFLLLVSIWVLYSNITLKPSSKARGSDWSSLVHVADAAKLDQRLIDAKVSVVMRSFRDDLPLASLSAPNVAKKFPEALEIVVVVRTEDLSLFRNAPSLQNVPRLRVVGQAEPKELARYGQLAQKNSKLNTDLLTNGNFILFCDSDVFYLRRVTYDDLFWHGKPTLFYRSYAFLRPQFANADRNWPEYCWRNGTASAFGTTMAENMFEYSASARALFPRSIFPQVREYLETTHRKTLVDFLSTRQGLCGELQPGRETFFSDFNFLGIFGHRVTPNLFNFFEQCKDNIEGQQLLENLEDSVCQLNPRVFQYDLAKISALLQRSDLRTVKCLDFLAQVLANPAS
eukprot:g62145.t1